MFVAESLFDSARGDAYAIVNKRDHLVIARNADDFCTWGIRRVL
jgi:hypothetical protein